MDNSTKLIYCESCSKTIGEHDKFLKCDECGVSIHSDCTGLDRSKIIYILKVRDSVSVFVSL